MYSFDSPTLHSPLKCTSPLVAESTFRVPTNSMQTDDLLAMGFIDELTSPSGILDGTLSLSCLETPKEHSELSGMLQPQFYSSMLPVQSYPTFSDSYPSESSALDSSSLESITQLTSNNMNSYAYSNSYNYSDQFMQPANQMYATDDSALFCNSSALSYNFPDLSATESATESLRSSRSYNRRRHSVSHSGDLKMYSSAYSMQTSSKHLDSEKKRRAAINQLYGILELKTGMLIEGKPSKAKILHSAAALISHYKHILNQNNVHY